MSNILKILNILITIICAGAYVLLLIFLFFGNEFILALAVPAAGFIICTVMRIIINAPRPYEVAGTENALGKKTRGKSFPSRHVFSIFVIATTVVIHWPIVGAVLLVLGVVLAFVRVKAGVHYVRDVVVGAVLGVAIGLVQVLLL